MAEDVDRMVLPNRAIEIGVVVLSGATIALIYWADRRYRSWAKEASLLAGPRARAATVRSSYRRKRTGLGEIAEVVGEIFEAVELARSRTPGV